MTLKIPKNWEKPSETLAARRFPYRLKPQEIFVSPEQSSILTFNLLEKQLLDKQVYAAVTEIQKMINRIFPESIREQSSIMKTKMETIGWFSFVTGGTRSDNCHHMFTMSVNNRMMIGSYHFALECIREERALFLNILKTIEINKGIVQDGQAEKNERSRISGSDNTGS